MQNETRLKLRRLNALVIALVLIPTIGALFTACGAPEKASGASPRNAGAMPVSAAPVRLGNLDVYLDAIGTVTPVYTVTVTSRVAGQLTEVDFKEGQLVKKGDLLAVVDPRPYEAALMQAQGQLARDQAALKNAKLDLERYDDAYRQHAIPEQQRATQQATVDGDAGLVRLDEGNLAAAQVNVDYTRIVSPIDGRVGLRQVDPGNIIQANGTTPFATITQLQPITVIFTIAEDHLSEVLDEMNKGHALRVLALDRSQQKQLAEGTLMTLDNQVDPTTGTVKARAQFSNDHSELFPNQFVNARLLLKTLEQVSLIPSVAVQLNDTKRFVYVIQADSTVQTRPIQVTAVDGEVTAVTGVQPGENVVTDGFDRVQVGAKVSIKRPDAATGAPAGAP